MYKVDNLPFTYVYIHVYVYMYTFIYVYMDIYICNIYILLYGGEVSI